VAFLGSSFLGQVKISSLLNKVSVVVPNNQRLERRSNATTRARGHMLDPKESFGHKDMIYADNKTTRDFLIKNCRCTSVVAAWLKILHSVDGVFS
jgi:hypothetical protein